MPISHHSINKVKSKGSKIHPVGKGIKHYINANIKHAACFQQKRWDAQVFILPCSVDARSCSQERQDNAEWF